MTNPAFTMRRNPRRSAPAPQRAAIRPAMLTLAASACAAMLAGCGGSGGGDLPSAIKPSFIPGEIKATAYDGTTDDLLTAGLGSSGLQGTAPAVSATPTAAELRKLAIYNNYRALLDMSPTGGYGTFFGPAVGLAGEPLPNDGKVKGTEYIAVADDGTGDQNVTLMVQVPDSFNPALPCIVSATSSGSRGIYGAVGTAGDWGIKKGCAVAYTDKGTGNGLHDLTTDAVQKIDGTMSTAAAAGKDALFRAKLTDAERAQYVAANPGRVAYKHAHSQQNPEKDWGKNTLQAIEFAFYVLNVHHNDKPAGADGQRPIKFLQANTVVIASSVSNGGGAALAAAEQDVNGLIDGVAVSEPNAQPGDMGEATISTGTAQTPTPVAVFGKPLLDYFTYANLYQPCAALSTRAGPLATLITPATALNRCASLHAKGLLTQATAAAQAEEALDRLHQYGWLPESDNLHQSMYGATVTNSIVYTYTSSYGRFPANQKICGMSLLNTGAARTDVLFGSGNGIPPTGPIALVFDQAGPPLAQAAAVSLSTGAQDYALDNALCMRALATGKDPATGSDLTGDMATQSQKVRQGMAEVQLTGLLRNKPTIIVAGRSDALLPLNHASRAYVAKNYVYDLFRRVRYYEVTNAQHFDSFIPLSSFGQAYPKMVPLHVYYTRAMNLMWDHIVLAKELPPSQIVRTVPRAAATDTLQAANVPDIVLKPVNADSISQMGKTVIFPD